MEKNKLFLRRKQKNISQLFERDLNTTKVVQESISSNETYNLKNAPISFLFEQHNAELNKKPELKRSCEVGCPDSPKEQIPSLLLNENLSSDSGTYGRVVVYNGEAIKRPFKNGIQAILNEMKIYDHLSKSQCKYIVKRIDSCEKQLFLKMEYCESTLHKFMEDKKLDEEMIKLLTFQLVSAVKALHSPIDNKLVIHRDIKSDNILIKFEASGGVTLKVADFGSSKILEVGTICSGDEGVTQIIMAPEINGYPFGGYNERVDIWSIGCVVLQMITGKKNFWPEPECEKLLIDYQMSFNPKAPGFDRNTLSPELCDFLDYCFKIKQEDRLSATELLEHNYLKAFKNNHC